MSEAEAPAADRVCASTTAPQPVFVDLHGRRSRWIARVGRVIGLLCAAYLAATVLSLLGAPWVPRLDLPVLGPVLSSPGATQAVVLGPGAVQSPLPAGLAGGPGPASDGGTAPSASRPPVPVTSSRGTAAVRSASTTAVSTSTTTVPGRGKGATTTAPPTTSAVATTTTLPPGHSGTAPGRGRHG